LCQQDAAAVPGAFVLNFLAAIKNAGAGFAHLCCGRVSHSVLPLGCLVCSGLPRHIHLAFAIAASCCNIMCIAGNSSLIMLSVGTNMLSGSVEVVEQCGNLVLLDISQNSFSGTLPASKGWDELATYRACCNSFTGLFPVLLCTSSRILQYLDISFNQLSGNLPNQITLLSNLKMLNLASNNFSDWLTFNIFYLPSLTTINLSNNNFKGVLTDAVG
jgi:hypothetical protein